MVPHPFQFVHLFDEEGTPASGLVPVNGDIPQLSIDEHMAALEAQQLGGIDFVFFRRFSDGRSSQVAAYVVDNSDEKHDETYMAGIHQMVWLQGRAPLLYIAWPGRIDILTCARGPDFWKDEDHECQYNPAERFDVSAFKTAAEISDELAGFSIARLSNGTFWDEPSTKELAKHHQMAHRLLIQAVVETDKEIDGERNHVLRRLLLLTVLIKYLEDRRVFPDGWFGRFHKDAKNFREVLKGGEPEEVYKLLAELETKFNGEIFEIAEAEKPTVTGKVLKKFADLVEAKTLGQQRYLWKQFSFEHLPVEIISHLYEKFVKSGKGAVYTPPFLASLLLDHAMPYGTLTGTERILDPACGSGVFLVGAFRRLINVWRSRNDWKRPDVATLKKILRSSIFGIEIDKDAVDLTAFSLSLAICDALQPDIIWTKLKFDALHGKNLIGRDFFEVCLQENTDETNFRKRRFDIIIGNPPFQSNLSPAAEQIDDRNQRTIHLKCPDRQIAYLFLEQASSFLRPSGRVCLIQPSTFLYGHASKEFRKHIFQIYCIDVIFDFTSIRKLYEADAHTVAVLAIRTDIPEDHSIRHWTFRRTVSVKEHICFELDHYDRHRVSQDRAIGGDIRIWRAHLLGGGRLVNLVQRFSEFRTLRQHLDAKGWIHEEGFKAGGPGVVRTERPWFTGKRFLPAKALLNSGIDKKLLGTVSHQLFRSSGSKEHYQPPLIVIKKNIALQMDFIEDEDLAYPGSIVGIHAPKEDSGELRKLYSDLRDNLDLFRFMCNLNSTEALVLRATSIRKQDIEQLPYPENSDDLSLCFWEKALCEDVLHYMAEFVRLGQKSKLVKKAKESDITEYNEMFLRMLKSVYGNLSSGEPIWGDGLICQPFCFGECPDLRVLQEQSSQSWKRLIYDDNFGNLRTIRILRYYHENYLLIIKPDLLRYWIRSVAIRDADETLSELSEQGY
ncbi:MAG: N-6 DNA methylase [Pseudomonadota bacterium]